MSIAMSIAIRLQYLKRGRKRHARCLVLETTHMHTVPGTTQHLSGLWLLPVLGSSQGSQTESWLVALKFRSIF
jgi:hypothetical protein